MTDRPANPHRDRVFTEVRDLLERGRARLRRRHMLRGAVYGLWAGAFLALAVGIVSRLWWPSPDVEPWWVVAGVVPLGAAVGLFSGGAWAGLRPREMALLLDRTLGTDELLVTALHLERAPESWSQAAVLEQLRARTADLPPLRAALPLKLPRATRWAPLALALAAAVMFIPQRPGAIAMVGPDTPVQQEGERLEERISELQEEFEVDLPSDLETEVEDLVSDLKSGDLTEAEARERIEELQEQLERLDQSLMESKSLLKDLEEAAQELAREESTSDLADALERADMEAAADEARDLAQDMAQSSDEERRRAGEALQRAGERLKQSADQGLQQAGESMQSAGEQLQNESSGGQQQASQQGSEQGSDEGSEQGSQQGSQQGEQGSGQQNASQQGSDGGSQGDLEQLAQELQRQQELSERLQGDEQQLAQSQQLNGALEGSSQRLGGEGSVASGESSGGEGQGGGEGEGEPAQLLGVNDYGTGHTWEDEGTATSGTEHHDADRQSVRQSGQELDDFQKLYEGVRLDGAETLITSVDGQIDERGHIDTLPTRLTGGDEDAATPLMTLPQGYREAADQALSGERVPAGYREAVKEYFDSMEQ